MIAGSTPLAEILRAAGQRLLDLRGDEGSRILLLERGARVIGLYASDQDDNFLWNHPALATASGARSLLSKAGWPNPGGDRTWLAPEHALFFGDRSPTWKHYRVPPALDPGEFRIRREDAGATFRGEVRTVVRGVRRPVEARLKKHVSSVSNPLPHLGTDVRFAGYRTTTTMIVDSSVPLALWQLLQLPHGGEMLVSTRGRATPRVLFGDLPRDAWTAGPRVLRHPMNAAGNHKLGLTSRHCTGLAGYVSRSSAREWSLVVRRWQVNPKGRYIDTPWHAREGEGDCFQLCNVNADIGRFSELEHHTPAADAGAPAVDTSDVWAFRGPRAAIREIARQLLGIRRVL
jgi:hypothetical protein